METYSLNLEIHITNSQRAFSNLLFAGAQGFFFVCEIYSQDTYHCI